MYRVRIEFDHLPKAVNLNSQVHWAVRAKHAKESHAAVREAVNGLQLPLEPLDRVHLCSHFFLPDMHRRDLEQLRANVKNYVDALTPPVYDRDGKLKRDGISLIEDDKMTCVVSECQSWELRRGKPGFFIQVQEVPTDG